MFASPSTRPSTVPSLLPAEPPQRKRSMSKIGRGGAASVAAHLGAVATVVLSALFIVVCASPLGPNGANGGVGSGTASVTVRNLSSVVWEARFTGDSGRSAALVLPAAKVCWRDVAVPTTLELLSATRFYAPVVADSGGVEVRVNVDTTLDVLRGQREC